MSFAKSNFLWATFPVMLAVCASAQAPRTGHSSPTPATKVISLSFRNNGQRVAVEVGTYIKLTLGTVGPQQYDMPQVSTTAVVFKSKALKWPANPGGPTFIYSFVAASPGEALVKVPVINAIDPELGSKFLFSVTIRVGRHRPSTSSSSTFPR